MITKSSMKIGILMLACTLPSLVNAADRVKVKDANGNVKFIVQDSGYVGSGTAVPSVAFHALGDTAGKCQFRAQSNVASQNVGGSFAMLHNNGSYSALPNSGDRIGSLGFGTISIHPVTGASGVYYGAGITSRAEDNWSHTLVDGIPVAKLPAYLSFETASTSSRVERMRLTGSGNLGIGATAPTQKLEVRGGVRINPGTVSRPTCDATSAGTIWYTSGGTVAGTVSVCINTGSTTYAWMKFALTSE